MEQPYQQARIAFEDLYPEIDAGRFPARRIVGEWFDVWIDILMDGHDTLRAVLAYRRADEESWQEIPMQPLGNDRWHARFPLEQTGRYCYSVKAWPDAFGSWRHDTLLKKEAGQSIELELQEGHALALALLPRPTPRIKRLLGQTPQAASLLGEELETIMHQAANRPGLVSYPERQVVAARKRAECSAWYELMVRSESGTPGRGGRFADAERRLPAIAAMGFDIVYLMPIHPIGQAHRKGRNNALQAQSGDPGSPYAIGSAQGGHDAVHPELGTLADFKRFVKTAKKHQMDVALDFAVQCSPDHPWIKEHPEWFSFRPDGSIRHAENPPKKYEDIVNFNFASPDAQGLWEALYGVMRFWIEQGVSVFRVDNPHTKPFAFWEWLIARVHQDDPEVIFLSEAFTRPKLMYRLAKLGFTQSYSYFTWRNSKQELTEYLTELTTGWPKEYFRPNFFPTTPDIFPRYLHDSGRAGYIIRLTLAATLAGNYGMLAGYELCEGEPLPGKEEYRDSEKYEYKTRDWNKPGHIIDIVTRLNAIRRDNDALQQFKRLRFLPSSSEQVIFYCKWSEDKRNVVFVAVNLDPRQAQESFIELPLAEFGRDAAYKLDDLLLGHSWEWRGARQHLRLDPAVNPVAIFRFSL